MPKRSTQNLINGIADAPDEPIHQGAGVAGFAHKDAPPPDNVSANVPAYDSLWRPVGVRVRGTELDAFDRYAQAERLKKGPALTALLQMLLAGEIDVQAVRTRIRQMKDAT
jgi:hypothetical protein